MMGSVNETTRSSSEENSGHLSYEEDDIVTPSVSVDLVKDVMRRLLKIHKHMKTLLPNIVSLSSENSNSNSLDVFFNSGSADVFVLRQCGEVQLFLWSRLARILHEEHQRCGDVYTRTLNMHDRMPFESLTYAVHHNTAFCDYMGEIISSSTGVTRNNGEIYNASLLEHLKNIERTQVVATYSALMVVEGSRESFLDPMSIYDLCKVVTEEKNRRKRLIALSLTFSMLDQDDQAIGEAISQQLPQLLLQRLRHLIHRIFGYPDKYGFATPRDKRGSPFRYYSAVIQSVPNSPLSSRKASPEIVDGDLNTDRAVLSSSGITEIIRTSSPLQGTNLVFSATGENGQNILSPGNGHEYGSKRQRSPATEVFIENDKELAEKPKKVRKIEQNNTHQQTMHDDWIPQKGEKVGRGPDWCFENQGSGCDYGEIVEVTDSKEVLVHWVRSVDSNTDNENKVRIFRYKYLKPEEHVVQWCRFTEMKTVASEEVNIKMEEFMLVCAVIGVLCHQREAVLPALQFQAIESMIHVLDNVDLAGAATLVSKVEQDVENREKRLLSSHKGKDVFDEDVLETHLSWDPSLYRVKEEYRRSRETVARVGWVLNALLSHKKLAFIFLELDGLRRVMNLINSPLEIATTYGCCIVLSQLAKGIVFEKLLRSYGNFFDPIMKFILCQWQNADSHDVQGSAGGFLFHALSFPCVVSFFDSNNGPQTTVDMIDRLLKSSEEQFDVMYSGLSLVALKCLYVYQLSHLMLSTRVIFRKHRFLSTLVTNSSPEVSLPRDPATVESVLSLLSSTSASLPDISAETVQSLLTRDRLVAFRLLVDFNFHQLLLRCTQFYFSQSRWELLSASLNVLCVLTVIPFVRPLIAHARYPDSGIVHLIMIVNDLAVSFQNGNASRESHLIPCVSSALQILLHLTVPPADKNDEASLSTFNQVCGMIRASDGVRTLLEVLRIRKDAAMSAKIQFFPVVARALQLMVALRRYADTRLLFDALGVNAVARELLTQYEDVQKEYISMMGARYAASEASATGRFMENVKCFLFDDVNSFTQSISMDPVELELRQGIIARSHIDYSQESLLELIRRHLESEGLHETAARLRMEAQLASDSMVLPQATSTPVEIVAPSTIGAPSLEGIVRSYLRQQHEKCTNPIATLPQFDLRKNHVYHPPPPPVDHMRNVFNRQLALKMGIDFSLRMKTNENHLIYRYPGYLFDISGGEDGLHGDTIAFCDNGDALIVGTSEGAIALFDTFPDDDSTDKLVEQHLIFDNEGVNDISVSNDGSLLAVVSSDHVIGVMRRNELPAFHYRIEGSRAGRFSNDNTFLLTTCDEQHTCRLYDISTQREVRHFSDPSWVGENLNNVATFDASSHLVLSDAILWDVRCSEKPIYRFDRFTESFCNAFHPSNLLVLIDEKVWDLRALAIAQTVSSFKNSSGFYTSNAGQVIYSFCDSSGVTNDVNPVLSVVDSLTFETVFSTEVRPPLRAFAIDPSDRYCAAILEQQMETVVRVFSTSSGPLPGQKSFPQPQDDDDHANEDDLAEDADEDGMEHDSFWSYGSEEYETDDDDDDDEDEDDDDDEGDDESNLSYHETESGTISDGGNLVEAPRDTTQSNSGSNAEEEEEDEEEEDLSEDMENLDNSMSST